MPDELYSEAEQSAWKLIKELESTIKHLREYGVEPACPSEFLDKAKEDFKAGFHSFSLTHAQKGLEAAQGLLQAYTEAWNAMYYANDELQKAKQIGDTSEMVALYAKAEENLSENKFVDAAKKANNIRLQIAEMYQKGEPAFSVEVTSGTLKPTIWNRTKIRVKNTGKVHALNVRLRMNGPADVINLPEFHKLEAGTFSEIEIGIKPNGSGELPIDVGFTGISVTTNKSFNIMTRFWINAPKEDSPPKLGEVEFFDIREIFMIYNDGRLLAHITKKDTTEMDEDILSSMLIAIRNFVQDSFQSEDSALKTFSWANKTVVIEKGNYIFLAVIVEGTPPPPLSDEMARSMERIEGDYAGIIEKWDGQDRHFKKVGTYLDPIFDLVEKVKMKREETIVKVKSGLEFYRGFVRLKVAVVNETDTVITDANLLLTYNKEALTLEKVEPPMETHGSIVILGSVQPKEKKTVAYYLDPLICQESTVDCTLTYKDYKGKLEHIDMKRRPVDIVCPLFYTPQTLNIAMLKRLVKDLKEKDSKLFTVGKCMSMEKAFEKTKDVVQGHDVKFVREINSEEQGGVKVTEGWFYGRVQHSTEEIVIKVSTRSDTRTLEVYVASPNLANLTGLLAELGHTVSGSISGSELVTDEEVKATIQKEGTLLDKLSESEVGAESTETSHLDDLMRKLKKS